MIAPQDRRYAVEEIERMRLALQNMASLSDRPYVQAERVAQVEDHLRTYMLNGTTPEELEALYATRSQDWWNRVAQQEAYKRARAGV